MLKKLITTVFASIILLGVQAQKSNVDKSAAFTMAFGSKQFSTALSYQHLWKLGKKQKFAFGGGVRLTSNFGNNLYYTTAPAKLTSGKTGLGVFFAKDITQNIDSVLFKKSQVNALNLSINFSYNVYKKYH